MIYLIFNIILGFLKKTVHNLFTITANTQGVLQKKPSETLKKILEKYVRKSSFFSKMAASKNELIHTYFLKDFAKS